MYELTTPAYHSHSLRLRSRESRYVPVATRGAIIYFVMADLALVDPM